MDLGWRWVDWITLFLSAAAFLLASLCLPETFSPIILSVKAGLIRKINLDHRYQSQHEQRSGLPALLAENLRRIIHFIFQELTTVSFGLYLTLLYMLIYGFLEGFDYIFTKTYFFDVGQRYSSFGAIAVGTVLGLPYVLAFRLLAVNHPNAPEHTLRPALLAAPLLTASLFWLGWTNRVNVSYWSDLVACCLFGWATMVLFTTTYHYLLETYGTNAASAMAAITFMRYTASGGMVMITEPMYKGLGVAWTCTLLGCVAALLTPVPWVFWWYGSIIRRRSKWATIDDG